MAIVCPTITAFDGAEYNRQLNVVRPFAERIHIDLMDGVFAPTKSPDLSQIWWPNGLKADIHLMYQEPMKYLDQLIRLRPNMVIIHNEAQVHHMHFAAELHQAEILTGLAILQDTPIEWAYQIMHSFDQVLIFSGRLGYHGGQADLGLIDKVKKVREYHPDAEIAWDGGVDLANVRQLVAAGVEVLNVGGAIHSAESPADAYAKLNLEL